MTYYSIIAENKKNGYHELVECGLSYDMAEKMRREYIHDEGENGEWDYNIEEDIDTVSNDDIGSDDGWGWYYDDFDEPDFLTKFGMSEKDFL